MASIVRDKKNKNKYRVYLCVGNERQSKTIYADSKKEAERIGNELEARMAETGHIENKTFNERKNMKVVDFAKAFIESSAYDSGVGITEKTRTKYVNNLTCLSRFLNDMKLCEVTVDTIYDLLAWLRSTEAPVNKKSKGVYSENTVHDVYVFMNMILDEAANRDYITYNPCTKVAKRFIPKRNRKDEFEQATKEGEFYNEEQLKHILNCIDKETEATFAKCDAMVSEGVHQPLTIHKERVRAMEKKVFIYLAVFCGARRGEILGLKRADIHFRECYIHFQNDVLYTPEGGTYEQNFLKSAHENGIYYKNIYVNDEVLELLRDYMVELDKLFETAKDTIPASDRLFISMRNGKITKAGGMAFPDEYSRWFKEFVARCNLPVHSFHKMRHSCISYMCRKGVDMPTIAKIAGHSTFEQLRKFYLHLDEETLREARDGFEELKHENRDNSAKPVCFGDINL